MQRAHAMNSKAYAYAVSALLLGAMLAPAFWEPTDDSFPLSTFPMFARERSRSEAITSAVLLSADGSELPVPASYVANVEPMQAIATLSKTVAQGRKATRALCEGIARRVVASGDSKLTAAERVLIVTRSVDAIDFLAGRSKPGGGKVHVRCKLHPERKP
jgi:hypothetical protein